MTNQLDTTQRRVRTLAILARGSRSRGEIIDGTTLSLSTYTDFETGTRWPRSATLRRIESALGWKPGIIDEVTASDIEPDLIGLEHMKGHEALVNTRPELRSYTDQELLDELRQRASERNVNVQVTRDMFDSIERGELDLAASRDLGAGIHKGDLPDE